MYAAGGAIIELLSTNLFRPPTRAQLDAWVETYDLRVTALIDPTGVGTRTQDTYGVRETVYLLDLRTMRIVEKLNGSVAGVGPSAVAQAVPRLLALLRR